MYTQGGGNVIRNLEISGVVTQSTVGKELLSHLMKQIIAMAQLLIDPNCADQERDKRFADAKNYIDLAYSIYKEGQAFNKL